MTGTLYAIGVGPGDPELLTLKAVRVLQSAPVIAYPAANDEASAARSIAAAYIPPGRTEIEIRLAMQPGARPDSAYDRGASAIAAHLEAGQDVALLCEGDPLFYGSFAYLQERLAGQFPCVIVPGITSISAAAAASGGSLAIRDEVLTVLPATLPDEELAARLALADSCVVVKLGRHLDRVRALLERLGLTSRAAYVEQVTRAGERVVPLAEMQGEEAPYFSLILIGPRR